MTPVVSIDPGTFVEGGAVPKDKNLLIEKARFAIFEYGGKATKPAVGAMLSLKDDEGKEYEQFYSAGDPDRFAPNPDDDGRTLVAKGTAEALSKSSNFSLLMANVVSSGFSQSKIIEAKGDIGVLDGTYAYFIALKQPERTGIVKAVPPPGTRVYDKEIAVPSKIIRFPWEKAPKGGKTVAAAKGKTGTAPSDEVIAKAVGVFSKAVDKHDGKATRIQVSTVAFKELGKDPLKDTVIQALYTPEVLAAVTESGFSVDGEIVSKAD